MSLIHWWPLNGDSRDYAGGKNGGIVGDATFNSSGKIGKCLSAGNGTQITAGIRVNNCNLLDEISTEYSAAVWIKPHGTHVHYEGAFISSGDWNNKRWNFGIDQGNSKIQPLTNGSNSYYIPLGKTLTNDQWYHVTTVYKGGKAYLYLDGVLINSVTATAPYQSSDTGLTIGRETYASGYFSFNGDLCDMRIYDHALSQAEVRDLSKALAAHYTFNDILSEYTTNINASGWSAYSSYWTIRSQTTDSIKVYRHSSSTNTTLALSNSTVRSGLAAGDTVTFSCFLYINGQPYKNTTSYMSSYTSFNQVVSWESRDDGYYRTTITLRNNSSSSLDSWIIHAPIFGDVGTGIDCEIRNLQIEKKDHATPYTVSTRPSLLQNEVGFNNPVATNNISLSSDCSVGCWSFSPNSSGYIEQAVQGDVTHGVTASMWLKADLSTNWVAFADYGSQLGFGCYNNYGVIASVNGTNKRRASNLSSLWKTNDWNHVVVSMSSNNTVNRCWINGTEVTYGSADYWTHTGKFTIGCRYNGSYSMNFPGLIDDFRFYHTCLSDVDVQDLYHTKAMISNEGDILCGQVVENKSKAQVTNKYDFDTVECNEEISALYDCLEYLESTGTQYIDTGYVTTSSNYSYEIDIIPTTIGSFYSYMGFMASSTNPRAGLHEYSGTFMIGANATTNATGHSPVKDQRVRLKAVFKSGDQRLYKDGVLIVSNATTFNHSANTLSTHIFARNYSSGRNQSKIKLFEALIYEGDYPVRRFIPVRRKSDNVLGLYETFTKTFCANSGTGTFTAGPTLTSDKALISSTHKIGGRNIIEI